MLHLSVCMFVGVWVLVGMRVCLVDKSSVVFRACRVSEMCVCVSIELQLSSTALCQQYCLMSVVVVMCQYSQSSRCYLSWCHCGTEKGTE